MKRQIDDWFYKYMSILLAQPFDVAKTVLQVRSQALEDETIPLEDDVRRQSMYRNTLYSEVWIWEEFLPAPANCRIVSLR